MNKIFAFGLLLMCCFNAIGQNEPNDCVDAIVICGNGSFSSNASGSGTTQEISSCGGAEHNSLWLKVNIVQAGTLGFDLIPNDTTDPYVDYDFWVFPANAVCGSLGSPIRCCTTNPQSAGVSSQTGMYGATTVTQSGPGANGNGYVRWINVLPGQSYYIAIDRPSGDGGFQLNWTGTATTGTGAFTTPPTANTLGEVKTCSTTPDIGIFDLGALKPQINADQVNNTINFYATNANAVDGVFPLGNIISNTSNPQQIFAKVVNNVSGCFTITDFTLRVYPVPDVNIAVSQSLICPGQNVAITFTGTPNASFNYSVNGGSAQLGLLDGTGSLVLNQVLSVDTTIQLLDASIINSSGVVVCSQALSDSATVTVSSPISVTTLTNSPICQGEDGAIVLNGPANATVNYTIEGNPAIQNTVLNASGQNTVMLPALTSDTDFTIISITDSNAPFCTFPVNYQDVIVVSASPEITAPQPMEQCAPGFGIFNLDSNNVAISGGNTGYVITYHLTSLDAQNDVASLTSPYQSIAANQTVYVRVESPLNATCVSYTTLNLITIQAPIVSPATPLEACADNFDNKGFFDLTVAGAEILNGQSGLTITYHSTAAAAQFGVNAITNPTNYYSALSTVYASIVQTGTTTNCRAVEPIQLIVHPRPAIPVMSPYELCDDNTDGIQVFDLTTKNTEATGGVAGLSVEYYILQSDAQGGTNPIATPTAFANTTAGTQQIWVGVATAFGCRSIAPLTLRVNPLPVLSTNAADFVATECEEVPGQAEFHFDEIATAITGGGSGYNVVFYETQAQADNGGNDFETAPYLSGNNIIYARITDGTTGCWTTAAVTLNVIPAPIATPPAPIAECDINNDGFAQFNMVPGMQAIEAALADVTVTAHETADDAEFGVNVIPNPNQYLNVNANTQTIYLRVKSDLTDCFDIVTLQLIVNPTPVATMPSDYELCDDGASDTDGQSTFDLTTKAAEIYGSIDPTQFSLAFFESLATANLGNPAIANPMSYLSASKPVYARITNNVTGCFDVVTLNLVVNPLPVLLTNQYVYRLCETDDPVEVETFDLTTTIPVFIADQNGVEVTYYHTFADANAHTNAIGNPTAYENHELGAETLFVRFTIEATGCYRIGFLDVDVDPEPIILAPTQDELTVCDTNGQGIGEFDLAALIPGMINGEPGLVLTFHETAQDAQDGINAIPNPQNYVTVGTPQSIWVHVVNTITGCSNNEPVEITLITEPAPQAPELEDITLCDDQDNNGQDNRRLVDLTVQNTVIAAAFGIDPVEDIPSELIVEYYTTKAAADAGVGRIITPGAYMGTDGQQIWVRVERPATECYSLSDFLLHFNKPHALTRPAMYSKCDESLPNNGMTEFDLTTRDNEILGAAGQGQGYSVNYYQSQADALAGVNVIADPEHYTNPAGENPKTLYVEVITTEGCKSYTTLTVKVLALPVPDFTPKALQECDDNNSPDGIEEFDLTLAAEEITNNGQNYILSYYTSYPNADADIAGIDPIANPSAYASASGEVYVRVELDTHNPLEEKCHQVVTLELIVNPLPPIGNLDNIAHCEQNTDGADVFNLTEELDKALEKQNVDPAGFDVDFFTDAALTTPAIPVNAYPVSGGIATIWVRVRDLITNCEIVKEVDLLVEEAAIANPVTTEFKECDDDGANDGVISTWDLTLADGDILGAQSPADYSVTYYESEPDLDDPNAVNIPIANPQAYTNTTAPRMEIWAVVTNTSTQSGCKDKVSFFIEVIALPEPVIAGGTICVDKSTGAVVRPLVIDTGLTEGTFVWTYTDADGKETILDETGPVLLAQAAGQYNVVATGVGPTFCESDPIAAVSVLQSGPAVKVDRGYYVTNYFSDNQTITVTIDGYGVYEYSLDEGPWQPGNVFDNVSPGSHTVKVRDTNPDACDELVITGASIVDYPNFFTPNGDGFHDTWNIIGLADTGSVIYIFDRYGKLLKQISPDSQGWDGTFNGVAVPADDYWFTVTYPEFDGTTTVTREFKSHFAIKR